MGASVAALSSLPYSLFFKCSLSLTPFRTLPRLTRCITSSLEFNITFAPKPDPDALADIGCQQLFIPWIVCGDDGKLKLQSHPPARLLHEMANTESKKANNKKKDTVQKQCVLVAEPKHSKAARRFHNQNSRESQRLNKVLATFNKSKGYICAAGEKKYVLSLYDDYLKSWDKRNLGTPLPRLFTVGRLDVATTGLIVVTNDGDFTQSISHPSANLTKESVCIFLLFT